MGDVLMQVLVWMPVVNSFCIIKSLQFGAFCSIYCYFFLSPLPIIRAVLTASYHHDGETFIAVIQCIFLYTACVMSVVTFFMSCAKCMDAIKPRTEEDGPHRIHNDTCIRIFLIFCLIFGFCEVVWGILALVRAFVSPGLLRAYNNKTYNPYPAGDTVCEEVGRSRRRRTRTRCRPISDSERQNREKWDRDHVNDTVYYYDSKIFDAAFSAIFTVIHLYGFYPLIVLRSHILELPDEPPDQDEVEEEEEKTPKTKKRKKKESEAD